MTTQALENFENMNAQALAAVKGGGVNQCVAGTTGKVIEGALAGGAAGATIAAAVSAPVAEGGGIGPAAGAGIGAVLGGISNGLYGASQYCN
ncbi:hypothetical protein SMU50_03998 [Streptococcus mutans 5SM3]|uniref:hypothetical protein n=1 Tax=Streptococcus mutans TaxID=1309 RepID=UPI0002B5916F|nr:hypothetical protein [Streptococcus mutans]EMB78869.1 hypothetical protein SMU50_03998 [Streptococcus mutans 5SM3]